MALVGVVMLEDLSDADLWARACAGEPECFGLIFDRHGERIRAYCARRTGSLDAADDLVAIVFLEAWRRRDDVDLVSMSALPWLYGVAGNTIRRRHRVSQAHRRALERLPAALLTDDHADLVAGRVDDERHLAQISTALTRLRRDDQEVLLLCVWQGLDYASAAVALGVPVGTVRSRLSRARRRLREESDPPRVAVPITPATAPTPVQELS